MPVKSWSQLDNAAKIFPPTSSKGDSKVFRFVCELYETVDAQILQRALDKTVARFPFYQSVLKKGLFWYYFEETALKPTVTEENAPPCAPLYNPNRPGLLFRVCYYKKRINLEVFHALADGMGAVNFLRTLVYFYLAEKHPDCADEKFQLNDSDSSPEQLCQDAFKKYYSRARNAGAEKETRAYRPKGARLPENRIGIFEGLLSVEALRNSARQYRASVTEFLAAVLLCAAGDGMSVGDRAFPAVIAVPVDLRRFFQTRTARNFFGLIHVRYDFGSSGNHFSDVVASVRKSFDGQLVPQNMQAIIDRYSALENNFSIRAIPLGIKILCLKLAGRLAERKETANVSNMGRIVMPPKISSHIRLFSVIFSTGHPQVCLCSFGDTLAVTCSSRMESTDLPRCFFRRLADLGIEIEISSNREQREGDADALL